MNDELPSMPYPEHDSILGFKSPSYSAEQMREYAKQAVAASTTRREALIEQPAQSGVHPPDGKLVPAKPTREMSDAGGYAVRACYAKRYDDRRQGEMMCDYIYRKMLEAAPQPAQPAHSGDAAEMVAQPERPPLFKPLIDQHPGLEGALRAAGQGFDVGFEAGKKMVAQRQPLTEAEYTAIAHRTASKYSHRSDPTFVAYTFLPHTLKDFVRAIEAKQSAGAKP